jgi:hypothetical protein
VVKAFGQQRQPDFVGGGAIYNVEPRAKRSVEHALEYEKRHDKQRAD